MPKKRQIISSPVNSPVKRRKTQRAKYRKGRNGDVEDDGDDIDMCEVGELGIIKSVSLKNFMCHGKLEFEFGSNVNFVIGRNGSGKSAVLTAIILGLGGKSNVTGRGQNIKSFIKKGKQCAEIIITLRNFGPEAYKQEEYGNYVIVERKLLSDGSSCYKLKGEMGNVVSTKKEELCLILDVFNIQVDNPVSILTQDISRTFLNSKNPKDKYTLFFKATQLEHLKQSYSKAEEIRRETVAIIERKEEAFPHMEKEVKDWERKWKFHQSLEEQRNKIYDLKNELAWAIAFQSEQEAEEKLKLLELEKKATPKFQNKFENSQNNLKKVVEEQKETQQKLKIIVDEIDKLNPQKHEMKLKLNSSKQEMKNMKLEFNNLKRLVNNAEKEISGLEKRLEELRNGSEQDYVVKKQKEIEEIKQLEQKESQYIALCKKQEDLVKNLEQTASEFHAEFCAVQADYVCAKQECEQLQKSLFEREKNKINQLYSYGKFTHQLLDAIEKAAKQGRFKKNPRGPIGRFVKLRENKWALAVECCIKRLLYNFFCDNFEDEKVLREIFDKVIIEGRKPGIIVSKFISKIHDVKQFEARSKYPTVMQVLEISDPVVINCLIDQASIESILLIENNEEARNVMLYKPPINCKHAYTLNGDQLYPQPSFRYYSCTKRTAEVLHANYEKVIRDTNILLHEKRNQLKTLENKTDEVANHRNNNKEELTKAVKELVELQNSKKQINQIITELKMNEDIKPIDVTALEEELIMSKKHKQDFEKEAVEKENVIIFKNQEISNLEMDYTLFETTLKDKYNTAESLKEIIGDSTSKTEGAKSEKQHFETKYKEQLGRESIAEKEYEKAKFIAEKDATDAELVCHRINTRRSIKSIEYEIVQIEKNLKTEENSHGSKEEITLQYLEKKEKYEKIKRNVNMLIYISKQLGEALGKRFRSFQHIRNQIAHRVKILFHTGLSQRNYSGKLVFDHKEQTLDISAQPNKNCKTMIKDTKSLSGGERSYVTINLILALWDAVDAPFRILDEYDVFMDMINRKVSMDLMLSFAARYKRFQFIFLSPLHMVKICSSPDIKVHSMPEPERNEKQKQIEKR